MRWLLLIVVTVLPSPARGAFDTTPRKLLSKTSARGVVFSADGAELYTWLFEGGGGLAVLGTADLKKKAFHAAPGGPPQRLERLGDTSRVLAGTDANQVVDAASGKATGAGTWYALGRCAADGAVYGVGWPSGKDNAVALVDPATGQAARTVLKYSTTKGKVPAYVLPDPACKRIALFFGADPRREVIALYDLATGKPLKDLKHDTTIGGLAWSRDGKELLVGDKKGRLVHLDVASGKATRKTKVADDLVGTVLLLPDGSPVIGGQPGAAWVARVLDPATDQLVQELPASGCSSPSDLGVSADGQRLAVSCDRLTDIGVGTVLLLFTRK